MRIASADLPAVLDEAFREARGILPRDGSLSSTKENSAYLLLRRSIASGALTPGTHLIAKKLADAMGSSPIPVRSALQRLAAEGLVSIKPHSGAFVTELPFERLVQILEVRQAIEELAVRRAATRISDTVLAEARRLMRSLDGVVKAEDWAEFARINRDLHWKIHSAAESPPLMEELERLLNLSERAQAMFAMDRSRAKQAQHEHAALLDALRKRQPDIAVQAAREHRQASIDTLRRLSETVREDFHASA